MSNLTERTPAAPNQRLDSWKAIADYLSRDVRTAIRWEKERGLPVNRIPGGRKQGVFAFTKDLDAWLMGRGAEQDEYRSLAVLPFLNHSGDADLEYLADGLTESLISRLAQIPSLRVLARSTVFRYRKPGIDALAAARELKVPLAVSGIIRSHADQLKISVELLNAQDGSQVWGMQRTQSLGGFFDHEARLAEQIADKLSVQLTAEQGERLRKTYTDNPEAMQYYWKSRYEFYKFSEQGIMAAIELLQRALACDPSYAKAHAALAECYSYLAFGYSSECPMHEFIERAIQAAQQAVAIDDTLAEAHVALALSLPQVDLDLEVTEREFQRALELNPSLATAHNYYSYLLLSRGRFAEVDAHVTAGVALDPFSPVLLADAAALLGFAGSVDKAMMLANKALAIDSSNSGALYIAGFLHQMQGDNKRAIELLEDAVQRTIMHTVPLGILGNLYASTGDQTKAGEILARLDELVQRQPAAHFSRAILYCGLGEMQLALEDLRKAAQARVSWMVLVHRVPWFVSLHGEPDFQELVRYLRLD